LLIFSNVLDHLMLVCYFILYDIRSRGVEVDRSRWPAMRIDASTGFFYFFERGPKEASHRTEASRLVEALHVEVSATQLRVISSPDSSGFG
jgi:hypothetical protein